jgi:hypothetical protein
MEGAAPNDVKLGVMAIVVTTALKVGVAVGGGSGVDVGVALAVGKDATRAVRAGCRLAAAVARRQPASRQRASASKDPSKHARLDMRHLLAGVSKAGWVQEQAEAEAKQAS